MPKRIPGLPDHWQDFFSCILMHVAAPFTPLLLEYWFTGAIDSKSLYLFVAMYSLALGITSCSLLLFGATFLVGFMYSAAYGTIVRGGSPLIEADGIALFAVAGIALVHCFERFNRHVIDRTPFWEFGKNAGKKDA